MSATDLPGPRRRPAEADVGEWLRTEASMRTARWFGVVFAVFQITVFVSPDPPAHVRPVGYLLAGLLAVANLVVQYLLGRIRTLRGARSLAWATLLLDAALVSAFVWLYAFDADASLYLLFFILPAEAALKFQAVGALVAWAACTSLYVARELWASDRYGAELNVTSISFRMGVLLIVSLLVGMFARKLAERSTELRAALDELERQQLWRQGLIDMLAHDLRSPVGTATSTMMLIRDRLDRLTADEVRRLATSAVVQNERALRLTQDLLDLARSQQGRLELQLDVVPVAPLIRRVVEGLPVPPGDVLLTIEEDLHARIDPARLEQVVANLVSNAAKHGRPPIEVSARRGDRDLLEMRVSDHGGGVTSAARGTLFAPFAVGNVEQGSVGLGLWIVRTLVAAHGGTVEYEPSPDQPAFVVRLPGAARSAREPSDASIQL
ncbi:MAG: hypothetical protein KY457_03780 [Actinobacteria bacterium]|nr:hypothetical protein [Actinomycetota bacterium]